MDAASVSEEMDQARLAFRELVDGAAPDVLRRRTAGTRWTNRQLLFHMVFGYLMVRTLLPLVHGFGRLPLPYSRRFAAVLHGIRRPYHVVNYVGSCAGGAVLTPRAMAALLDRVLAALQRTLAGEDEWSLGLRIPSRPPGTPTSPTP